MKRELPRDTMRVIMEMPDGSVSAVTLRNFKVSMRQTASSFIRDGHAGDLLLARAKQKPPEFTLTGTVTAQEDLPALPGPPPAEQPDARFAGPDEALQLEAQNANPDTPTIEPPQVIEPSFPGSRSVQWWAKIKANGWEPDASTLSTLRDEIRDGLKKHASVIASIQTPVLREGFEDEFATDILAATEALTEIEQALEARRKVN